MKQIKTSELQGMALDYCVAQCEELSTWQDSSQILIVGDDCPFHPSSDWSQGGPIIEREGFSVSKGNKGWSVTNPWECIIMFGSTPLDAAMRCYVASKLGDVVSVPDEIV